jgi:hypothetical protein
MDLRDQLSDSLDGFGYFGSVVRITQFSTQPRGTGQPTVMTEHDRRHDPQLLLIKKPGARVLVRHPHTTAVNFGLDEPLLPVTGALAYVMDERAMGCQRPGTEGFGKLTSTRGCTTKVLGKPMTNPVNVPLAVRPEIPSHPAP